MADSSVPVPRWLFGVIIAALGSMGAWNFSTTLDLDRRVTTAEAKIVQPGDVVPLVADIAELRGRMGEMKLLLGTEVPVAVTKRLDDYETRLRAIEKSLAERSGRRE